METQDNSKWKSAEDRVRRSAQFFYDKKFELALKTIEKALEINPNDIFWHFNKAVILDYLENYEEAIKEYEFIINFLPNDLELLNRLGVNYIRTGEYQLAFDVFEGLQGLDRDFERGYCSRIILYGKMGNFEMAEQMFYLAQQINPDCSLCFYNLGVILFTQKELQRAISCWLRTAEIDPKHPRINYWLSKVYLAQGDEVKSQEYFSKELSENNSRVTTFPSKPHFYSGRAEWRE